MTEKCPNPNCKDGLIGVLDNGFDTPVVCCICEGKLMKRGALRGTILISGLEAESFLAGPEELLARQFRQIVKKVMEERKVSGGFFAFRLQWAELSEDALDFK